MRRRALMTNTSKPVTISVDLKGGASVALCKINNNATESKTGKSYNATIELLSSPTYRNLLGSTINTYSGNNYCYSIKSYSVIMNGIDVTSDVCIAKSATNITAIKTVNINIPFITGDIVITAQAYCYVTNNRVDIDGSIQTVQLSTTKAIREYVIIPNYTTHIKGFIKSPNVISGWNYIAFYNANKTIITSRNYDDIKVESSRYAFSFIIDISSITNIKYFRAVIGEGDSNTFRPFNTNYFQYSIDGETYNDLWRVPNN